LQGLLLVGRFYADAVAHVGDRRPASHQPFAFGKRLDGFIIVLVVREQAGNGLDSAAQGFPDFSLEHRLPNV
jgi:hypothetical protein